jgi:hypothetical protein
VGGAAPGCCAQGKKCKFNTDCQSGACNNGTPPNSGFTANTCVPSLCDDGVKDGNETDVDCGGTSYMGQAACSKCQTGQHCGSNNDCVTSACDPTTVGGPTCVASQCNDHQQDGNETGMDCGGTDSCQRCVVGGTCLVNSDCVGADGGIGYCSLCTGATFHTCVSNHCADCQTEDGESDVDCGQVCPTKCGANKTCFSNFDCNGLTCTQTSPTTKQCE